MSTITAINWNRIEDNKDLEVWNRLVSNFWLPEKVPLSNDLKSWHTLTEKEKLLTTRVFVGLTMLDTIQGSVGAPAMMKDAKTQHEEAVYTNISFMEAFAKGTEFLTPSGWKDVSDVTTDDRIMQYDADTTLMSFVNPTETMSHFAEEVYEIATSNGRAKQVVSGGHRVHYEEKIKHLNGESTWIPKVVEARDLAAGNINMNTAHRRFRETGSITSQILDVSSEITTVERLLVAIQADGSFDKTTRNALGEYSRSGSITGTVPVKFTFSKTQKIKRLTRLADEAGWTLKHYGSDKKSKPGRMPRYHYVLMVPIEYVDRDKDFWVMFADKTENASYEWAYEFIQEIGHWDSHHHKNNQHLCYTTVSKRNADFVVAMAAMAGMRSWTRHRVDNRSSTFSDTYMVHVIFKSYYSTMQSFSVKRVDPQQVYCVQVPSTFLLTRNGGGTVISGNCVHAKSYSSIFSTLCSTVDIDDAFRWAEENTLLQKKSKLILDRYEAVDSDDPLVHLKLKIASVFLESFLFYSGFYLPLYWASHSKLSNTADLIRLIIRDEAVHGYYVGYKFQQSYNDLANDDQEHIKDFAYTLLLELYENEVLYTESLYDEVGLTEDVKKFLHYNANKALMNLGFDALFPKESTEVSAGVMSSLSPAADENHDFFSGSGSSYVIGKAVVTEDEDWSF